MEKIILSNGEELNIDRLRNAGNLLYITVNNGDMEALEGTFSQPENLERIILADNDGNPLNVFKNHSNLAEITKRKNVTVNEITEETADIVTVTLEQEEEWKVAQRKMRQEYDGAIMDLGDIVSDLAMNHMEEGSVEK